MRTIPSTFAVGGPDLPHPASSPTEAKNRAGTASRPDLRMGCRTCRSRSQLDSPCGRNSVTESRAIDVPRSLIDRLRPLRVLNAWRVIKLVESAINRDEPSVKTKLSHTGVTAAPILQPIILATVAAGAARARGGTIRLISREAPRVTWPVAFVPPLHPQSPHWLIFNPLVYWRGNASKFGS